MAFTQADLDRIDAAIAGGAAVQSLTFADQTFVFRSMDDMLKARAMVAQALNETAGGSGFRLAATSKGV